MSHKPKMLPVDGGRLMNESLDDRKEMLRQILYSCQDDAEFHELVSVVMQQSFSLYEICGESQYEDFASAMSDALKILK